jgi:glutamate dehydrogenase/leucine dehydrogenase
LIVESRGWRREDTPVAIEGYGNAGSWLAILLEELGYPVVAVSDSKGAILATKGLSTRAVLDHKKETGSVVGFEGAETMNGEELFRTECPVLVLAALEESVTADNADVIAASLVLETANYPVTPEGETALIDRGITVVPDILASGGGVSVSYLEWVQDLQRQQWPEERVNSDLTQIMRGATEQVLARADLEGSSLREAAYLIAVDRVAQAEIARGYR